MPEWTQKSNKTNEKRLEFLFFFFFGRGIYSHQFQSVTVNGNLSFGPKGFNLLFKDI